MNRHSPLSKLSILPYSCIAFKPIVSFFCIISSNSMKTSSHILIILAFIVVGSFLVNAQSRSSQVAPPDPKAAQAKPAQKAKAATQNTASKAPSSSKPGLPGTPPAGAAKTSATQPRAMSPAEFAQLYKPLTDRVKKHDTTTPFFQFRIAAAFSKNFAKLYAEAGDMAHRAQDLYAAAQYNEALRVVDSALEMCYACMPLHDIAYKAHWMLDSTSSESKFHQWVYYNMLRSMVTGVTGRSTKDPITIISPLEETALLTAMSLQVVSKSKLKKNGSSFDVINCTDASAKAVTMYFLLDIVERVGVKQKETSAPVRQEPLNGY